MEEAYLMPEQVLADSYAHRLMAGAGQEQHLARGARLQHRAPSVPDLIIAATAELAGRTVLHLDKDFDVIADITGKFVERLNVG